MQNLASLPLVGLPNIDLALASTVLNIGDSILVAVRVGDLDRDLTIRKLSCCGSERGSSVGPGPDEATEGPA